MDQGQRVVHTVEFARVGEYHITFVGKCTEGRRRRGGRGRRGGGSRGGSVFTSFEKF